MSSQTRSLACARVVVTIGLLVALVGIAPRGGEATPADDTHTGDVLQTLNLAGTAADCTPNVGTSLALVQGSKVGFPANPVLIVTSCLASGGGGSAASKRSTLYFINPGSVADPGPGTANIVKTIQTKIGSSTTAPGNGWAGLVLAPDKGLLYGCGTEGSLYSIDYVLDSLQASPVTDGTTSAVFAPGPVTKPGSLTSCTGLAWDPSNNTIYESTSSAIFHFDPAVAGTPTSFLAPAGCTVSGLSVVGGVLLVACNPPTATVYRLDKSSGAQIADHPTMAFKGAPALSDLECDPVSFSGSGFSATKRNIDAVWSKGAAAQRAQAFWVPPATCGLPATETVFAPAACPDSPPAGSPYAAYRNADGSPIDSDGDGLWNCWKDATRWPADGRPGIDFDGDGNRDVALCANDAVSNTLECATRGVKDLFVEIDYMQFHKPDPIALASVKGAFLNAPVNPPNGIRLHVLVDDQIAHNDLVALEPCTAAATAANGGADFDSIKLTNFGTATERTNGNPHTISAKRLGFRYMLIAHNLVSPNGSGGSTSSGCSEIPGDDSVISLGSFAADAVTGHQGVGTTDQQAGTILHELGHNLGLRHGGGDNLNCKPNYLSVMNYSRQFTDLITNRRLDYSRDELPIPGTPLSESALLEDLGIGIPSVTQPPLSLVEKTVFSVVGGFSTTVKVVSLAVNPALPTPIDWDNSGSAGGTVLNKDINKLAGAGCNGNDGTGSQIESLLGFNDWAKLQFNARASLDFAGGVHTDDVHPTAPDKTFEQEEASFEADFDADGVSDPAACGNDVLLPQFQPDPLHSQPTHCAIDIKPGTTPVVLHKQGDDSNVAVAILSTPSFDAPNQVVYKIANPQMLLNDQQVKLNKNREGTCSVRDVNGDGFNDLVCQFISKQLPLGSNFAILDFQVMSPQCGNHVGPCGARARQFITVVK